MSLFSNVPGALKFLLPLTAGAALAGAIAFSAQGGGEGGRKPSAQAISTPTSVSENPASPSPATGPTSTSTAMSSPARRPVDHDPKPVPLVPASQVGRQDCPPQWYAWRETSKGRFSVCFPNQLAGGLEALSYQNASSPADPVLWLGTSPSSAINLTPTLIGMTLTIEPTPSFLKPGSGCMGLVPRQAGAGIEGDRVIAGRIGHFCSASGSDLIAGKQRHISELILQIPMAPNPAEGFLVIVANSIAGSDQTDSKAAIEAILATLVVH